jgi:uncharacterized protein involved in exopolysaccharide biosynthesis
MTDYFRRFAAFSYRYRRTLMLGAALGVVLGIGFFLTRPSKWTSTAQFVAGRRSASVPVTGIASQLGLSSAGSDPTQSPFFLAELVKSREVLRGALARPVHVGDSTKTVAEALGLPTDTAARSVSRAVDLLRRRITSGAQIRTSIVTVSVQADDARVARDVLQAILDETTRYNITTRRNQARLEREFSEKRTADSWRDLRSAEDSLLLFVMSNRSALTSPDLRLEYERRQRVVGFRQQVALTAAQLLEQARVEEVREQPAISIVDPPSPPADPDPRGGVFRLGSGFALGIALGYLYALWLARAPAVARARAFAASVTRGASAAGPPAF